MADDGMLFQGLEETKKHGGMISVHAESTSILDMLIKRYTKEMERLGAYAHALKGYPNTTISRGKIIVSGGEFIGECGHGQFLKRKPIHHLDL